MQITVHKRLLIVFTNFSSSDLKTEVELEAFKKFCKESEHKKLRDWYQDKKPHPWFIPSLNEFFSKIAKEDWYLTPGDTNLNESTHPATNMQTGTNLPLLDSITKFVYTHFTTPWLKEIVCRAFKYDRSFEEKIQQAEENCILPNHRKSSSLKKDPHFASIPATRPQNLWD